MDQCCCVCVPVADPDPVYFPDELLAHQYGEWLQGQEESKDEGGPADRNNRGKKEEKKDHENEEEKSDISNRDKKDIPTEEDRRRGKEEVEDDLDPIEMDLQLLRRRNNIRKSQYIPTGNAMKKEIESEKRAMKEEAGTRNTSRSNPSITSPIAAPNREIRPTQARPILDRFIGLLVALIGLLMWQKFLM